MADVKDGTNLKEAKLKAAADEREAFKSEFILSTDAILKRGVPSNLVDAFRWNYYRLAYSVDKWYRNGLEAYTFRTVMIDLTYNEGRALLSRIRRSLSVQTAELEIARHARKRSVYRGPTIAEIKADPRQVETKEERAILTALAIRINAAAQTFVAPAPVTRQPSGSTAAAAAAGSVTKLNGSPQRTAANVTAVTTAPPYFFVKLNTRSAKDAAIYQFREAAVKQILNAGLAELTAAKQRNPNSETLLYVKAVNQVMKLKTADDVLEMFEHSYRVHDDLTASLKFPPQLFDVKLVLRQWRDDVPNRPQWEFRGFVHDRTLHAVTQYFTCVYFPELSAHKRAIGERILNFFNSRIRDKIDMPHYVIDFLLCDGGADDIIVLELNPFYKHAGAGLFSWKDDRHRLMHGPYEIRVIDKPFDLSQSADPYANISGNWLRYMHPELDRDPNSGKLIAAGSVGGVVSPTAAAAAGGTPRVPGTPTGSMSGSGVGVEPGPSLLSRLFISLIVIVAIAAYFWNRWAIISASNGGGGTHGRLR